MQKINFDEIKSAVREMSKLNPAAIYAWGSWMTCSKEFSAADFVLVLERNEINFEFLKQLTERYGFLNLTVLTPDEIKNGAHASFNPFYFTNLLFSSILLYGRDILSKEFRKFPEPDSALWRVECILQKIRNVLSGKSESRERLYLFKEMNRWLSLAISEFLFFTKGYYVPDFLRAKRKFEELFFEVRAGSLEELYGIFSRIKEMYLNHSIRYLRTRPGIFVLIRDGKGRYLMLERSDGRGFEFVKGGVERGETFEDAALREIREETGITVAPGELVELPVALSFRFPLKEGYEIRIYKGFVMEGNNLEPENLNLDGLFSSARFMEPGEIQRSASFPEYCEIVEEVERLPEEKFELILNLNEMRKALSS